VPREGALHLPVLPVDPTLPAPAPPGAEALDHLTPVARLRPLPPPDPPVQWDDRRADARVLTGQAVVLLAVEGGVGQHTGPVHPQRCLGHGRAELWRVVGRADADGGGGEEMAGHVAGGGQPHPGVGRLLVACPLEEVLRGVAALQASAIDGGLRFVTDEAAFLGARWPGRGA
jgi:hypothetical protein